MNNEPRITPRNLGYLLLEDACLSDFWYLSKLRFQPPFADFGAALFSDCQAMQEAVLGYYFEKDGCLPKEFAPFCDLTARVEVNKHWSNFGYRHKSGCWLYGSPDEVLYRKDGTVVIWDHKTAHPKGESTPDRFRPQYEVQIIGYGDIAEHGLNLGRVSAGALGYWDLQHKEVMDDPHEFIKDGKLWASFVPHVCAIDIDYKRVDDLLIEAMKIWQSKTPPEGLEGCRNCKKLEALFCIQATVEDELDTRDREMLSQSGNDSWIRNRILRQLYDRRSSRLDAYWELQEAGDDLCLVKDSMSEQWEFFQ